MFSTDSGARFEGAGPRHADRHAVRRVVSSAITRTSPRTTRSGRQFLMEPIEWTSDGWWRPVGGKVPVDVGEGSLALARAAAPPAVGRVRRPRARPAVVLHLRSGLLGHRPGHCASSPECCVSTRSRGTFTRSSALPGVFQQRVIDKAFAFETRVTFDARAGREAAGLHMYHDPLMNFWLASTVSNGEKRIAVGKHTLGVRQDLVVRRESVRRPARASQDRGHRSRDGDVLPQPRRHATGRSSGGRSTSAPPGITCATASAATPISAGLDATRSGTCRPEQINGLPEHQRQAQRGGNVWTAATFGVFAVQDGADRPEGRRLRLHPSDASLDLKVSRRHSPRVIAVPGWRLAREGRRARGATVEGDPVAGFVGRLLS